MNKILAKVLEEVAVLAVAAIATALLKKLTQPPQRPDPS